MRDHRCLNYTWLRRLKECASHLYNLEAGNRGGCPLKTTFQTAGNATSALALELCDDDACLEREKSDLACMMKL